MSHPKVAAQIPKIKVLRKQLDYGDETCSRFLAFCDDIRVFRKSFETNDRVQGHKLYEWRSDHDRLGLIEMTIEYLEVRGNGAKFWPDEAASQFYNKWQYSKDHVQYVLFRLPCGQLTKFEPSIKRIVLLLLWRMNLQQQRNDKHKAKKRMDDEDEMRRRRKRPSSIDVPMSSAASNADASTPLPRSHHSSPRQAKPAEQYGYAKSTFQAVGENSTARAAPEPSMQFDPAVDWSQASDANASRGPNEDHADLLNFQHSATTGVRPLCPLSHQRTVVFVHVSQC